jgi:tetratricopeptide (TPR) repeat protein
MPGAVVDSLDSLVAPFFQARVVADRYYREGIDLESRGQWERALRSYRTACDLHPQRLLYLVARGRVCQAHGLTNEAAACYALARKLDPTDPVVLFNEADLLAKRGDLDAAAANLRSLLDREPDRLRVQMAAAWRLLGDLELARRNAEGALHAYRTGADAFPSDRYLSALATAGNRIREVAASGETAPRFDTEGLTFPAKASTYAFAGAMLFGLPDDDGVDVPAYPGLGFVSIDEVAEALARPLALFRRRRVPFAAVYAVGPVAAPVAHAFATALGIPVAPDPIGPRLTVSLDGEDPAILVREGSDPGDWAFCIGMRLAPWHYNGLLDGALVAAPIEVPWATRDTRARPPARDAGEALAHALAVSALDNGATSRHLRWHAVRRHLRAGDPLATYRSPSVC